MCVCALTICIIICCLRERDGRTDRRRRGDRPFHRWLMINPHRVFERVWRVCALRAAKKKNNKEKRRQNPFLLLYSCRPDDGDLWSPARTVPMIYYCAAALHTHARYTRHCTYNTTRKRRGVGMSNNTNSV